jgi:cytochrome c
MSYLVFEPGLPVKPGGYQTAVNRIFILNGENMKTIIISMTITAGLLVAGSVLAVEMPAEAKAKCGACHAIDQKGVGPSFMDVSRKYKGDQAAAGKIAAGVAKGGSFGWNLGQMPPKGLGANDAEIKSISEFIAGLAK